MPDASSSTTSPLSRDFIRARDEYRNEFRCYQRVSAFVHTVSPIEEGVTELSWGRAPLNGISLRSTCGGLGGVIISAVVHELS